MPIAPAEPNRLALVLPGGGIRVAYQAGVVKALQDHDLRFSIADAASGGTINLAALLSGVTPDDLCRRWRELDCRRFISARPLGAYARFPRSGAFGDFDSIRDYVFPRLGIELPRLRTAEGVRASFNVCEFDSKTVIPVPQEEMSLQLLLAGISLPLATPPVRWQGRTWTDAVWIRDANLMEAVRKGAEEIWVAWCIGNTDRFEDGLLEQYVHMIEMATVGKLNEELAEIAALNRRIAAGDSPHGHTRSITVHVIHPQMPLPLDPDLVAGRIDTASLIAYGYRDARAYLAGADPAGTPLNPAATRMRLPAGGVHFREVMSGRITWGEQDPLAGAADPAAHAVALHAAIDIDDIRGFIIDPDHHGGLAGYVVWPRRGGHLPVERGTLGLFSPTPDPRVSHMIYAGGIVIEGQRYWFNGRKHVRFAGPWRLWSATTRLHVTVHEGEDERGPIVAAGLLTLSPAALVDLLRSFRPLGTRTPLAGLRAVLAFMRFFAGELARHFLTRRTRR